ncbi:MAG: RNA-binding protein [Alphaproteobacteria bacterium]|nr:RNA-binding protein [Alphaproteobacteria bacterium]
MTSDPTGRAPTGRQESGRGAPGPAETPARAARRDARPSLRRCIVTRESHPPAMMVRFVIGPDGRIVPDLARRLPGRGLWVRAERDSLDRAVASRAFARAARAAVTVEPDLAPRVEALLEARVLDLLGLARKAGEAVAGYEKVMAAVRRGPIAAFLVAVDASAEARRTAVATAGDRPLIEVLAGAEIGAVFGRSFVVHVALRHGALATRLVAEALRLRAFRAPHALGKSD